MHPGFWALSVVAVVLYACMAWDLVHEPDRPRAPRPPANSAQQLQSP
jgi:hypothetical protein